MSKQELAQIHARFFNSMKSMTLETSIRPWTAKGKKGHVAWNSKYQGTYIRSIHGKLN